MNAKQTWLACAALLFFSSAIQAAETRSAPASMSAQPVSAPVESETGAGSIAIESAPSSKRDQAAQRQMQMQAAPGSKISLSPLPVTIYLMDKQKPMVAFTTPCIMIERMTNGFPPVLAFENFMFEVIGNINESDLLPFKIEPVCI